ncbi:hypothetical protein HMPREF9629_00755 [Peptoanaerobacter stomatis]|uniref:Membrane-bound metal-dependent hydrolase n=2 Tax=Peptoanaerobacter stomatis TaxID=796937 RepID=G9X2Z8_9FIRM|nr:hypothetical protein HMPREF9629_00755 [Peptoanaerobacter stomatis]
MKGNTHMVIGISTYANYIMLTGKKFDILDIPICLAFSVLPDIDTESSKISSKLRKLPLKIIISSLFLIFISIILYFTLIKKILPLYCIALFPIMVLFLKFFSKNKILKKISLSIAFLIIYYILLKYTKLGFTKNILLFFAILPYFEHRGFSHSINSLLLLAIILFPIYVIDNTKQYYVTALLSYFSHLFFGDIFTKKGIKIFYPFSKKNYSLNVFKNKKIYNNLDIPFIITFLTITFLIYIKLYKKM